MYIDQCPYNIYTNLARFYGLTSNPTVFIPQQLPHTHIRIYNYDIQYMNIPSL